MKKIEKLTINPEKVIKNEELVILKGGYNFTVMCWETMEYWGCGDDVWVCYDECMTCCPGDCSVI